ncbi:MULTISPECIES: hypothetical protein [Psychrobacter]|uniref:hypothetical protein n=1 Tax=Psychrobacter TaxID=497 RepID=UPI00097F6976|nr:MULTISPECIES: hypothetical protein [Psychrobacter]SJN27874.1 hypothetical protein CZ794_05815 [Psychrobacter sp. JB385]
MPGVSKNEEINAEHINHDNVGSHQHHTRLYELLKQREQYWWQARQQLLIRKERKMVWYSENSLMMWLLWQLVGYVVVAMVLMLISNLLGIVLPLWQYIALFVLQTVIFVFMLMAKGRAANKLQHKIDKDEMVSEEAFNEMVILAEDSLFPDVHANAPISLKQLYDYFEGQFHLTSLHRLLQKEVDTGRLLLTQQRLDASILPPDLADDELDDHASEMIYKSMI